MRQDGSDVRYLGRLGHVGGLAWTDTMPGGNEQLTCTLAVPPDQRDKALDPGRTVRAIRGASIQWEGILDEPVPGDKGWTLTARGAGTWGGLYQAEYTSWTAASVLSRAISRGLGWVQGSVGGGYLTEVHDTASMTVTDFLNLYTDPASQVWRVHRTFAGNQVDVLPLPSAVTRLLVTTTPAARTLAGYINVLWVRYQATADNATTGAPATFGLTSATLAASIARHGRQEAYWDLSQGGVMTAGAAQALGAQALAKYTAASWAGPFQVGHGQYLTAGGAPVDLGCEKAGEVVRLILADGPYGGEVNPAPPVTFPVGKVEYHDDDGSLTVTPYQVWSADLAGITGVMTTQAANRAAAAATARAAAAAASARAAALAAHRKAVALAAAKKKK
jgi:hypothetical protein